MGEIEKNLSPKERAEFLGHGVEWLLRMGLLESPDVQTALTANIYKISDRIESVALVADTLGFKLLVYLKLFPIPQQKFYNKVFSFLRSILRIEDAKVQELDDEEIGSYVADMLQQVLPDYDLRIVFDEKVYLKSKELAEKLVKIRSGTNLEEK